MPITLHGNGTQGIRWSVAGVACSAFGTYQMQKASSEDTGEEYIAKDAAGNSFMWVGYDHKIVVDFEYLVVGASANISASVTKPGFGALLTFTDPVSSTFTGSNFICQSSKVDFTNTEAAKVSGKATAWDAITA